MLLDTTFPHIQCTHSLLLHFPILGRDTCVDSLWMAYESLAASGTNKEFLMPAPAALPLGTKVVLQCLALPTSRTQSLQKYETKIVMWVTWMERLISCGKLIYTYKYWVRRSKSITSLDVAPWTPSLKSCDMNWSKAKNKYQIVKPSICTKISPLPKHLLL